MEDGNINSSASGGTGEEAEQIDVKGGQTEDFDPNQTRGVADSLAITKSRSKQANINSG